MKKFTGQFRHNTWDPILIISQIVALQAIFYVCLGAVLACMDLLVGSSRSLDHLFKYQEIHVRDFGGKLVITGFIINAFMSSAGLWWIVERTKQCLDFSTTAHLIHLVVCWFYNASFPVSISWWLLNLACLTVMCVCGEFLCLRRMATNPPIMAVCIAVIGKDNSPLLIMCNNPDLELEFQYKVHTALDVVDEKLSSLATAEIRKLYLGLLRSTEQYKIYGYVTNTKIKFIIIVEMSNNSLRDNDIQTMFRKIHNSFVDVMCNPFYTPGDPLTSKKFHNVVNGILSGSI